MKERAYQKQVTQEGDAERYGELRFRIDETIFAAQDRADMKKAKIIMIVSSDFMNTSKSLFWPDVIMLARTGVIRCNSYQWQMGFNDKPKRNR